MLKLILPQITDTYIRENFKRLQKFFEASSGTEELKAIEILVTGSTENLKIKHGLGYIPRDVLLTRLIASSGTKLKVHFGAFTKDEILISTTGAVFARILVGTTQNAIQIKPGDAPPELATDTQEYTA